MTKPKLPKTAEKKSANEASASAPADTRTDAPAEVKEPELIAPLAEDTEATEATVSPTEEDVPAEGKHHAPCADGEAVPRDGAPSGEEEVPMAEEPALTPEPEPEPEPARSRHHDLIALV